MAQSILEGSFILNSGVTKTYYIAVWISETNNDQLTNDTGSYGGIVRITSALGEGLTAKFGDLPELASTYIQNLYNDGSDITTVNIGDDTSNPEVSLNSTQSIMLDNNGEYRYYGASPNNYVSFNNELWRIISVSNVKSSINDTSGEQRIKLIRNESIGEYSWDSSPSNINNGMGTNDWTEADLMTELNTLYYNKQSGVCYNGTDNQTTTCDFTDIGINTTSRTLIDDALWYLGGINADNDNELEELYPNDYYVFERGSNVYDCRIDDGSCPRSISWTGKIAVMYPSDYLYSADLNICTFTGFFYDECTLVNWLYQNSKFSQYEHLISPVYQYSGENYPQIDTITIDQSGMLSFITLGTEVVGIAAPIRPTLYLKSDVIITGGNGTSTNPYTLA